MTTSGEQTTLVVVDTNVLLAATDRSRTSHAAATSFLNEDERRLALTSQIVREYLAVATRPIEVNGFGLTATEAVANVREFLADMDLLGEDSATTSRLIDLVAGDDTTTGASGKQIHDANVVAVATAHGASVIVTDNTRHFVRFQDVIAIESLSSGR